MHLVQLLLISLASAAAGRPAGRKGGMMMAPAGRVEDGSTVGPVTDESRTDNGLWFRPPHAWVKREEEKEEETHEPKEEDSETKTQYVKEEDGKTAEDGKEGEEDKGNAEFPSARPY